MSTLPDHCAIAFKEWAGVCHALADGRQTLIVRKGGISEGPGGFAPEHAVFWLYPTHVHQAQQGLRDARPDRPAQPRPADCRPVDRGPRRRRAGLALDSEEDACALDALSRLDLETMRKRFAYRQPGLWVLGVRVYRREPALDARSRHPSSSAARAGSSSTLRSPPRGCRPVLDDDTSQERLIGSESVLLESPRCRDESP